MSANSQCEAIAKHLRSGRAVTPLEALHKWGVFRLSARIYALKARGMSIDKIMVKRGEKKVASYFAA